MEINWGAVIAGFAVATVLAFATGLVITSTDTTMLAVTWGLIGAVSGLVAGFIAGGTVSTGAVHGGMATVFGSLITLAAVAFTTLLFAGLVPTFGVVVAGLLLLVFYAVPGALGGAIGAWTKGRRTDRRAGTRV